MTLTDEQVKQIKDQLLSQLDHFPEDRREQIEKQILDMSNQEIEEFVKQNQLATGEGKCVFCSIAKKEMPSTIVGENEENLAVLELNPLSRGHTLVISKEHLDKAPNSAIKLADKIKKMLIEKLGAVEVKISETKIMDHPVIDVLPFQPDEVGKMLERKKETEEELKKIQKIMIEEKPQEKPLVKKQEKEIIPTQLTKAKQWIP